MLTCRRSNLFLFKKAWLKDNGGVYSFRFWKWVSAPPMLARTKAALRGEFLVVVFSLRDCSRINQWRRHLDIWRLPTKYSSGSSEFPVLNKRMNQTALPEWYLRNCSALGLRWHPSKTQTPVPTTKRSWNHTLLKTVLTASQLDTIIISKWSSSASKTNKHSLYSTNFKTLRWHSTLGPWQWTLPTAS